MCIYIVYTYIHIYIRIYIHVFGVTYSRYSVTVHVFDGWGGGADNVQVYFYTHVMLRYCTFLWHFHRHVMQRWYHTLALALPHTCSDITRKTRKPSCSGKKESFSYFFTSGVEWWYTQNTVNTRSNAQFWSIFPEYWAGVLPCFLI